MQNPGKAIASAPSVFLWRGALLNGTEEPWLGPAVAQGQASWREVERTFLKEISPKA